MNNRSRTDQRLIDDLARLAPAPAERVLHEGRKAALKEHLMNELRQADSPASGVPRSPFRRRGGLWATLAGAVAAAAAIGVGVSVLAGPSTHPAGRAAVTPAAARHQRPPGNAAARLLAKIANVAGRQPAPVVRDSQYVYIETEIGRQPQTGCMLQGRGGTCHPVHLKPIPRHRRQVWLPVSNLCRPGLLNEPAAGSINMKLTPGLMIVGHRKVHIGGCPNRGGLNDPTYRFLQSLPTNPRTLLALIYREEKGQGNSPAQQAFSTIGDLLREAIAPPKVSAALYRAAALIPGVGVVPDVADAIGRHGVALSFTQMNTPPPGARAKDGGTGTVFEWIFDRATSQWLGERDIAIPSGRQVFAAATLQRAIVNRPGQVPSCPPSIDVKARQFSACTFPRSRSGRKQGR